MATMNAAQWAAHVAANLRANPALAEDLAAARVDYTDAVAAVRREGGDTADVWHWYQSEIAEIQRRYTLLS